MLLDTSFLLAVVRQADENHSRSLEVEELAYQSGETLIVCESVLGEFTTFLRKRAGLEIAVKEASEILSTNRVELAFPNEAEVHNALKTLKKYGFSSYTDALTVSVATTRGITKIVSFDSEFDKVPGIERIF